MPVVTSGKTFLALLEKSRAAPADALRDLALDANLAPQALAGALVEKKLLTPWQAEQLLAGRGNLQLGKYRLLAKLGEGGMGAVYKAVQTSVGRTVALKVMSESVVNQPGALARFQREIRAASALDHPNIVAALDADQVGDTHFLVMEYAEGRDLKAWMREFGRLPIDWSVECIRQAALGLEHAHERGLAHRDIKPSNLLVVDDPAGGLPQVKILDMGLARFTSEAQCTVLTQTGQVLGTIDYIAPEQAKDTKGAGIVADIFSLGASLFHMLAGQVPFGGRNPMEKLMARAAKDAPRVSTLRADVPAKLDDIIARMLERDPARRFQTPAEVARALAPFALGTVDGDAQKSSSLVLPPTPGPGSTIEAQADRTLNDFLGKLADSDGAERPASEPATPARTAQAEEPKAKRPKALLFSVVAVGVLLTAGVAAWFAGSAPQATPDPKNPKRLGNVDPKSGKPAIAGTPAPRATFLRSRNRSTRGPGRLSWTSRTATSAAGSMEAARSASWRSTARRCSARRRARSTGVCFRRPQTSRIIICVSSTAGGPTRPI
jgi:serine/threonine protein kinase